MAATRLIAMHVNKGKTSSQSLEARTDYAKNGEKTQKGEYVTGYMCDPVTVNEEFELTRRLYLQTTGRRQKNDVIAYQIRQSFKPDETNPETANRIGHELAMRFTKGKYAFIVATHIDKKHIHNHIIFNSVSADGSRKFNNFWFSGIALQRVSDLICLENGLSVIEKKYTGNHKRMTYPKRESIREKICSDIDDVMSSDPKDMKQFIDGLKLKGYECRQGRYLAVCGNGQKRFIRLDSLKDGYRELDIYSRLSKEKACVYDDRQTDVIRISLVKDTERIMKEKGPGYRRWASVYNLKQIAKSRLYALDRGTEYMDELNRYTQDLTDRRNKLNSELKGLEEQLVKIGNMKKNIINYVKTKDVYAEYRNKGYSREFFEAHRKELMLHKTAKQAFDESGMKNLPKVKELSLEYEQVLSKKRKIYEEYRKINDEAKQALTVQRNFQVFFRAVEIPEEKIVEKVNDKEK